MEKPYPVGLVWLRRDLRAQDHAALSHALRSCHQVHCAFVFDTDILAGLPRQDRRVEFIRGCLVELDKTLRSLAGQPAAGLVTVHGTATREIPRLASALGAQAVFFNRDYEPAAIARDAQVRAALVDAGIACHDSKDQVVFDRQELLTQAGRPYSVFTPYKNAWLAKVDADDLRGHPVEQHAGALAARPAAWARAVPTLAELGFEPTDLASLAVPVGAQGAARQLQAFDRRIDRYQATRDYPALDGTSGLSVQLRFGTLSVRALARLAHARAATGDAGAATWLSELIWRDFFVQVLANFPHVVAADGTGRSFRPAYDAIAWERGRPAQALFAAWCEGRTGYPLVDAAMQQLNQTGWMHNRLRMVTASFLSKDLGVDWRWGERYFARQLLDYDLAANNGGWQWASSSGCDAQPWFRIFHPVTQSRRFDPDGAFIRRWLPALRQLPAAALHQPWTATPADLETAGVVLGRDYPRPVVDHDAARARTLQRYAVVKQAGPALA
ncbi:MULTISPECIES: cryptochrome/photolyase family protein [Ramlibacter]|uniref:Deoxyribodipyrimidine photo-lyase n=1 Tax=Ramlibacter pinisoli TaxID=2682844 RepID=A0A6N8IU29_9BURK|nr:MULTISPECIES: deoxyribodipyrimidine photo-lyase [Ramlibacter]MBA2965247.1 deoxyribodipyrimidine photo-lyase [Ramlibacter sp. CGMCC 1.13660]MVQ30212.1 deoxyribodipyrimidine photo-lyase [Ramlibacter pinisoli]